jgi:two-component system heavy metal sensor histidine kinase CusS
MPFRIKTALVVLALTSVTMGVAFSAVWHRFVAAQRMHLDDALLALARKEAARIDVGELSFTDAPGPSANAVGPLPKYGAIYGANGSTLSTTPNWAVADAPRLPRATRLEAGFDFDRGSMPMRGVVVAIPHATMRVLIATSRFDLEDDAAVLSHAMTLAFVVGCLWASLVALWVATRLTREHRVVASVARRVASGDTSARVQLHSSDTDLQALAEDLNAMIERLVGLLAAQERFVTHAAHELRTPLASLRIELELALRTARDTRDYDCALRGALDSAQRLTDLAEDLLQLARIKSAPAEENIAFEQALADAISDVAPVGRTKDVVILAKPLAANVRGDRRGLARLFRNVLENAVHFSPRGGVVRVDAECRHGRIWLGVRDEGPGIEPGDEERVFEPFVRGARAANVEGTGLGLSIARGLARAFGGDVVAEHGPGGRVFVQLRPASLGDGLGPSPQARAERGNGLLEPTPSA